MSNISRTILDYVGPIIKPEEIQNLCTSNLIETLNQRDKQAHEIISELFEECLSKEDEHICCLCADKVCFPVEINCGGRHILDEDCLEKIEEEEDETRICPLDRKTFTDFTRRPELVNKSRSATFIILGVFPNNKLTLVLPLSTQISRIKRAALYHLYNDISPNTKCSIIGEKRVLMAKHTLADYEYQIGKHYTLRTIRHLGTPFREGACDECQVSVNLLHDLMPDLAHALDTAQMNHGIKVCSHNEAYS